MRLLLAAMALVAVATTACAQAIVPDPTLTLGSIRTVDVAAICSSGTRQLRQATEAYARQMVPFRTNEAPGTIIVDTAERYLYLVQPNDLAIRYGIGVGRLGFQWSGVERVSRKEEWPDWTPPPEMVGRQPYLPRFMAGGPGNPLGARALYLGHTEFRIHGTNQPETIGHAVSSGCIRLDDADVIDLYNRVQVGAKVVVRQSAHAS